jgi:calcineurin-like phosphoesterase family protein
MKIRTRLLTAVVILITLLTTTLNTKPNVYLLSATATANDPILIGAGDIGRCPQNNNGKYLPGGTMAEATAKLVASLLPPEPELGVVFVAGDNAYQQGTAKQYKECYDPTWGRFKDRTRPVPGNHEFYIQGQHGIDYYTYFGESAGKKFEGYYSYDIGEWHIIALNSELKDTPQFKAMRGQRNWLRDDLANNQRRCTLAYWHRPVFSSGHHGTQTNLHPLGFDPTMVEVWRMLDEAGVDVVVNGHDHNYERFDPQNANQNPDPNGMVEFVVGTGGENLDRDDEVPVHQRRNSAAFNRVTWGVLKLTLHPDSYDFEFIPVASKPNEPMFREKSNSPVRCVE